MKMFTSCGGLDGASVTYTTASQVNTLRGDRNVATPLCLRRFCRVSCPAVGMVGTEMPARIADMAKILMAQGMIGECL